VQAVFASYLIRVMPVANVSAEYVKVFLDSPMYWEQLTAKSKGTGQPNVNATSLSQLVLPLPPLAEQHRIVAHIEQLFAQTHRLAELLTRTQADLMSLNESAIAHLLEAQTPEKFAGRWSFIAEHFDLLYNDPAHIAPLRQAILELAVRGKLTRQDPQDAPVSELLKRIQAERERLVAEGKIPERDPLQPIPESEKPFKVPRGWEWVKLGSLCETITKGSSPKWQGVDYVGKDDGVLFITSKNVGQFKLLMEEETYVEWKFNGIEPRSVLRSGDILMNIVGASIGRTAIYDLPVTANINQAVCLIRLLNNGCLDKGYFLIFFNSPACIGYMFDKQVDNARANLSMTSVANFAVPLPPLAEQRRIVARVEQLMGLCDTLEAKLKAAQVERERLVEAVVAGIAAGI
jgi:type I restriction enzyme S subunit